MARRTAALAALLSLFGCGINPDSEVREIATEQVVPIDPVGAGAGEAEGESRIFLVTDGGDGDQLLRSVLRDVPASPAELMQALFAGPNDEEAEAGLTSALPPEVQLIGATRPATGTLNLDVSAEILDLPTSALQLVLAQIVFTAGELEGVRAVLLRVDGEIRNWPDGRGEQQTASLTVYDFPGYAESAQPPYPAVPTDPVA
jgi:spore germination protein GerM